MLESRQATAGVKSVTDVVVRDGLLGANESSATAFLDSSTIDLLIRLGNDEDTEVAPCICRINLDQLNEQNSKNKQHDAPGMYEPM